jgi:electron-transferring-flavoprotein dehydrogenase
MSNNREILDVDVLFVGAGPSTLAGAYHLMNLIARHNEQVSSSGEGSPMEPMIVIIEKAKEIGAHSISGAVIDPAALKELIPDFKEKQYPLEKEVTEDGVYFLTEKTQYKLPFTPGSMSNHGNHIISLSKFSRWLGQLVENAGVNIFPGFAGVEILHENGRVAGVRTGDKGLNANGEQKGNFEQGIDLRAKVTAFGDGARGFLSKQLIHEHNLLDGKPFQVFETGVKEVFEMPEGSVDPGRVIHTFGYPMKRDCMGGTFMYNMGDNLLAIGLVVPLDYRDPFLEPHTLHNQFKRHPFIAKILQGGKSAYYGAKVISAGGYYSVPKLAVDGALLIGESASLIDMKKFKGVHIAMKSGMLAAETIFESLKKDDFSEQSLSGYETKVRSSYIGTSMHKVRHFHRAASLGIPRAFFHFGIQELTGGKDFLTYSNVEEDAKTLRSVKDYYGRDVELPSLPDYDTEVHLDKLSNVYNSGTLHEEDQPCHLKILDHTVCLDTCVEKYRYPCNRFCPAGVYEMVQEDDGGDLRLQVNFANCVHCQTCDIKCPLDNIRWTPPEGGDGPNYTVL